jgi:MarR family transcriptional regulator, transcriptional regulator for hemolysin
MPQPAHDGMKPQSDLSRAERSRAAPRRSAELLKVSVDANRRCDIKLGYLIHDVSRMRHTAFDEIVKPLGVTRAQWSVIAHLSRHDGMVQTQLAELLDVGKASLGRLLDRLEATGFIERRPEPNDRRAKRVFLTKTSLQLLERLVLLENEFNDKILAGLTYKDRRELIRLLSIMKGTCRRWVPFRTTAMFDADVHGQAASRPQTPASRPGLTSRKTA